MHKVKNLIPSLCFVVILCVILSITASLFERKESTQRFTEFWDEPEEYDVWFMGNSHVTCSIQPMELWQQCGIRTYDLASPGSYMPQTYWTLMCALEYSQPELVVLDPCRTYFDVKHPGQGSKVHTGFDAIPLSKVKMQGICDIFDTWKERFEYICKFSIYHNRWEELEKKDFSVQPSETKGGRYIDRVKDFSTYQIPAGRENTRTDTVGFVYLKKIMEECQRRKIKLLLVEIPFCGSETERSLMNNLPGLVEEYDVDFMDLSKENLVDYSVDYADMDHVNIFGSEKLTRYMGEYLTEHYELTDYRNTGEAAERWDADYERYQQFWLDRMRSAKQIKSYVQWISNEEYTCYIYKKEEPDGLLAREMAQLHNVTYISLEEAEERMGGKIKGNYAFFVENENGELLDQAVFRRGKRR